MKKNTFSKRLKALRKESNITQRELAESTGLTVASIINYENEKREPTGYALASLESYFGVSGSYFFGLTDNLDFSCEKSSIVDNNKIVDTLEKLLTSAEVNGNKIIINDILIELAHLSSLKNDEYRDIAITNIKALISRISIYLDSYMSTIHNSYGEVDTNRLDKIKEDLNISIKNIYNDLTNGKNL